MVAGLNVNNCLDLIYDKHIVKGLKQIVSAAACHRETFNLPQSRAAALAALHREVAVDFNQPECRSSVERIGKA